MNTLQEASVTSLSANQIDVPFSSAVTAGSTVTVQIFSRFAIQTVSDNKGNHYFLDTSANGPGVNVTICRAVLVTGGSNFTVSVLQQGVGYLEAGLDEIDDYLVVDGTAQTSAIGFGLTSTAGAKRGDTTYEVLAYASWQAVSTTMLTSPLQGPQWDFGINRVGNVSGSGGRAHVNWNVSSGELTFGCLDPSQINTAIVICEVVYSAGIKEDFTGTPLSGVAPLAVAFTDLTAGDPDAWLWDFSGNGSGPFATVQNPTYVFPVAGVYSVSLLASKAGVQGPGLLRTNYVTATSPSSLVIVSPRYPFFNLTSGQSQVLAYSASGGTGPYTWLTTSSNPAVASITNPLSSSPTVNGVAQGNAVIFTTATDSLGATGSQFVGLRVDLPPPPAPPVGANIGPSFFAGAPPMPGSPGFEFAMFVDGGPPPPSDPRPLPKKLPVLISGGMGQEDVIGEGDDAARLKRAIRQLADLIDSLSRYTILDRFGNAWSLLTCGFDSDRAPDEFDDRSVGAAVGMWWVQRPADETEDYTLWMCTGDDIGQARWFEVEATNNFRPFSGASGVFP